jgi:hypothetical protein
MKSEDDILAFLKQDSFVMGALAAARSLNLPDWMIAGGFIRNRIWDGLHHFREPSALTDIDLIYFDRENTDENVEKERDLELGKIFPAPWSTKNQARMHTIHNFPPYASSEEALSFWVANPNCIGVRLETDDTLQLFAPNGIDELLKLQVRPNKKWLDRIGTKEGIPYFLNYAEIRHWKEKWPLLDIRAA